jgi:hypothetical protein
MLGDLVYEAQGKIAGYRILDVEGPKIEVTIIQNGTLKGGIEAMDTVTYWSIPRPGGAYYAEGKGVFMVKDNHREMANMDRSRNSALFRTEEKGCRFGILSHTICNWQTCFS